MAKSEDEVIANSACYFCVRGSNRIKWFIISILTLQWCWVKGPVPDSRNCMIAFILAVMASHHFMLLLRWRQPSTRPPPQGSIRSSFHRHRLLVFVVQGVGWEWRHCMAVAIGLSDILFCSHFSLINVIYRWGDATTVLYMFGKHRNRLPDNHFCRNDCELCASRCHVLVLELVKYGWKSK